MKWKQSDSSCRICSEYYRKEGQTGALKHFKTVFHANSQVVSYGCTILYLATVTRRSHTQLSCGYMACASSHLLYLYPQTSWLTLFQVVPPTDVHISPLIYKDMDFIVGKHFCKGFFMITWWYFHDESRFQTNQDMINLESTPTKTPRVLIQTILALSIDY